MTREKASAVHLTFKINAGIIHNYVFVIIVLAD